MRELKFRVWDVLNREMVYPTNRISTCFSIKLNGDIVDGNGCSYDETYPVQQYTGLKDKNGKEVYEGDIIKYSRFFRDEREPTDLISFVRFEECKFGFDLKGFNNCFYDLSFEDVRGFEVIGNIYENPNLI